ncbi:MAG TPA: prephenate dehydratase [Burkholderiaceae bacterium]|nr:prephenate dehydratase [Burkholderiaceae bacterium]
MDEQLKALRTAIDAIDAQVVDLLQRRARLAQDVGGVKHAADAPVYRPEREAEVLRRVADAAAGGPLPAASLKQIFREIISACRALERPLAVAFLGPVGTFTELAMRRHFGSGVAGEPCASVDEVFRSTEAGRATFGVVPVENSTEGAVNRTLDLLLASPLRILAEISIPVRHHLLTRSGTLAGVTRIMAHPQALAQCANWLNQHAAGLERVPASSNAEAARLAAGEPGIAAIAGEQAAAHYDLAVAAESIQDDPFNRTRFLVLGRQATRPSGRDKTSLILAVPNRAGAVYHLLQPLAQHGVSMTRFESRPARSGSWEYYFYVDVEGHEEEPRVADALRALQALCSFYRSLGSYPAEDPA